jgi:Do/DeqQ family serine protease
MMKSISYLVATTSAALLIALALLGGESLTRGAIADTSPSPSWMGQPSLAFGSANNIADVAEKAVHSVVNVSTRKVQRARGPMFFDPFFNREDRRQPRYAQSLGSGVVVSKDGLILTNNHVVEGADDIRVSLSDGRELKAELVGTDPLSDIAVLRLPRGTDNLQPIAFADTDGVRVGEVVLAIGNPFGVGQTVTMGIVSAKGRANVGIATYEDFIQTDAAINPGNSGGALVNMRGELLGINTAILSRSGGYQGVGFAVPSNMARPIMHSLVESGTVERGWLGVSLSDLRKKIASGTRDVDGALVTAVLPQSPAAAAGLRDGDIILAVDSVAVKDSSDLRNQVAARGSGKVKLEVLREGSTLTLEPILGPRPHNLRRR